MTRAQWKELRPGDILIERRSKTPRMVLQVTPGPHLRHPAIDLIKLRESWTPCRTTVLFFADAHLRLSVTGKRGKVPAGALWCPRPDHNHHARTGSIARTARSGDGEA